MVISNISRGAPAVNYFELARSIDMADVVTRYIGANIEHKGTRRFILCPFHMEKTASCLIDEHRFKCFGCGESGDRITFVKKLFNLPALEAAKLICRDFGLRPVNIVPSYRPDLAAEVAERRRQWNKRALRRQKVDVAGRFLCLVVRMISYRLQTPADLKRWVDLAQAQGEAETILDMLADRDPAVQDVALAAFEAGWLP